MFYPEKAIVLSAGFGSRLLPLTLDIPKPMLPLWGVPMLEHILRLLSEWGVKDALCNLHHNPQPILKFLKDEYKGDVRVSISFEPEILGTGGAISRASWFLDEKPFWVINADIAVDLNPLPLLEKIAKPETVAALWLHDSMGPRTVELDNDCVRCFQSPRPGTDGTYTFCGLQALSPDILRFLPETGFATITGAYEQAMRAGQKVRGALANKSFWADIGAPETYIETHRRVYKAYKSHSPGARLFSGKNKVAALRRQGVNASGFVSMGSETVVEPGAILKDCVLWDNAVIRKSAVMENAIAGRFADVSGKVRRIAARSDLTVERGNRVDGQLWSALKALDWLPEEITILPFEPRGSGRSFTRLQRGRKSVIMVRYSLERAENALYAGHARFLKQTGINVPDVIADIPEQRVLVLEDLGELSLLEAKKTMDEKDLLKTYKQLLRQVIVMHESGYKRARKSKLRLVPEFSEELYRWEREFFARHFLLNHAGLPGNSITAVMEELTEAGRTLLKTSKVLVHRDLQSSNVLIHKKTPWLIDFQGMRFGAAVYDLASLLYDPYMELPGRLRDMLFDYYCSLSAQSIDIHLFRLAAVQRLAQAIGAYARLGAMPGTAWFAKYLKPGIRMMIRAADQAGNMPELKQALEKTGRLARY